MFRRSGPRFADKNMRQRKNREHVSIPPERNMLYSKRGPAGSSPGQGDAERKHFPGYVFIRCEMTDELARVLRAIPHVAGFLGTDNKPLPVADTQINRMLATRCWQPQPRAAARAND
jgi:transcription antitermination factor NusG